MGRDDAWLQVCKSKLGDLGPRTPNAGKRETYECLECGFEWRCPLPKCGEGITCPLRGCGNLYVEWLSYDIPSKDIILRTDVQAIFRGAM